MTHTAHPRGGVGERSEAYGRGRSHFASGLSCLNVASLDAPLTAVVWQWCIAAAFADRIAWYHPVCLALVTWAAYVGDRLRDGARLNPALPHTRRHAFHRKHPRLLSSFAIAAVSVALVIGFARMTISELLFGSLLAIGTFLYYTRFHRRCRPACTKELSVGVVFTAGVTWVVWLSDPSLSLMIATCLVCSLFWANCLLIASIEREFDRAQGFSSSALCSTNLLTFVTELLVGLSVATLLTLGVGAVPRPLGTAILISSVGLGALAYCGGGLPRHVQTALAEVVLFTPLPFWLLSHG